MRALLKNVACILICAIALSALASCNLEQGENESEANTDESTETEEVNDMETEKITEKKTEKKTQAPEKYAFELNFGSYNIANGRDVGHDLTLIGEDIKDKGLDIVGLQEVDQFVPRSKNQDSIKILSESSGLPYYCFFKAIDLSGGEYGLGVLSRYPIVESESMQLYSEGNEQRILARTLIDVEGEQINFFVTHLSYESAELHATQTATVIEELKKYEGFVLTGDFNTTSFEVYYVDNKLGAVNNGAYKVPTFENDTIDNVIYDKSAWKFDKPKSLINGHSDHNMLYVKAYFKQK